jgi:hypothetical protein
MNNYNNSININNLISDLNKINLNKKTFDEHVIDKAAENIRVWINNNKHHNFPKSKEKWITLLNSQFETLTIKVDAQILLNNNMNLNKLCKHFEILKERINKYLSKDNNRRLFNENYDKSIKLINSFCRFKYIINSNNLFSILIKKKIINPTNYNIIIYSKKRKRTELEDDLTTHSSYYDTNLTFRSFKQLKSNDSNII